MLEAESFLEESLGGSSRYYQLFPKISGRGFTGIVDAYENPIVDFNDAIEQLQDILEDIQEER
jgi:hypothetical protein